VLLDLIFPPRCAGCRVPGRLWCPACAGSLRPVPAEWVSGIPLIAAGRLQGAWQQAIHTYKYGARRRLAQVLSAPLVDAVRAAALPISALTFVPLHPVRQRQRGFNQAERLAEALGAALSLPVVSGLARQRHTRPQVGLPESARRQNVAGAFVWIARTAPGKGLALVDDVCTTGATLEAAAEAVRQAGGQISALLVLGCPSLGGGARATPQTLPRQAVTSPE
jgi:ComF family protein